MPHVHALTRKTASIAADPSTSVTRLPGFALVDVWHLSVATTIVQALTSLALVRWQMNARLRPAAPQQAAPAAA